jgi:pimeloyl-ACP methyl ester carboxylesterase
VINISINKSATEPINRNGQDAKFPFNKEINKQNPVLLVHGLGDSKENVERSLLYAELKKNHKVFAVEYLSGPENAYGDIRDYARTLDKIINEIKQEMNIDKVHIVAQSMGGLISRYRIQKIEDDDVGTLVMIGTPNLGSDFSRQLPYSIWQLVINPFYVSSLLFDNKYQEGNPNQAINEMLPGSDFLFELNGNRASEFEVSNGGVVDIISSNANYYVINGDQLNTFSSVQNRFVKGDGIVPFDSARLTNVPIYPVAAIHGEEFNKQDIINLVRELLNQSDI